MSTVVCAAFVPSLFIGWLVGCGVVDLLYTINVLELSTNYNPAAEWIRLIVAIISTVLIFGGTLFVVHRKAVGNKRELLYYGIWTDQPSDRKEQR